VSGMELLDRGREALRREAWGEACGLLGAADQAAPLGPADLEGLATAAHLLGRDEEVAGALARAHQGFLAGGDAAGAARCAFRLGFGALNAGELGQAGGWLARAWRQLEERRLDCAERGYLRLLEGVRSALADDVDGAQTAFAEADAIGTRFSDPDLTAMARQALGRVLLCKGELARGVALLDEAMVAVQAGEVSPGAVGGIYCSVLAACGEIFDLRRAQEWTDALERWCARQPEVVPYRGHCLVRRAELLFLHGAWPEALAEARRAGERLSGRELGDTLYLQAEIHRLRGDLAAAEELHREAGEREREPRPGFALLRLAQGQLEAAQASIRQVCDAVRDLPGRASALDAAVEISLAAGDRPAGRAAAEELQAHARRLDAPYLRGLAGAAEGRVLLLEGDPRAALGLLRPALARWRELEAPYEAARAQLAIAAACRADVGCDPAELELEGACQLLRRLGAAPDLVRAQALRASPRKDGSPLTAREVEVLVRVASGRTNRAIAAELGISEKTVARHLSNIFGKLGLPSRAAATAYAFQHALL
jgi:DNA-binding CsgD family transcriptional regulator